MSGKSVPDHTSPHPSDCGLGAEGRSTSVPCLAWMAVVAVSVPWTMREIDVMRERCHLGAEGVKKAILFECGTRRSIRSIESQASRCHVSLKVRPTCPECGMVGVRLNRQTGLCPRCTELMHLQEEIAFSEVLQRDREELAGEAELAAIRRERDRVRKQNHRLCARHGLKTRRQRMREAR